MDAEKRDRPERLKRLVRSWQFPAVLSALLLLVVGWVLLPTRTHRVTTEDGQATWSGREAPPRREVVWEPARPVVALFDEEQLAEGGSVIHPQLADGGATLYFTLRTGSGKTDIYRARRIDGRWREIEPVAALNSTVDDIGPVFNRDEDELYLYSNRPGGSGGFDLYVSRRSEEGWSTPANLGPGMNSPAQEYDPALAPDGVTLIFSSNRTPAMQSRLEQRPEAAEDDDAWDATLRADAGLVQFDLYVARRASADAAWEMPRLLAGVNRPDASEGAPYVSPSGSFLYFASNRLKRRDGTPHYDIFRARLADGRVWDVENLGDGVNSPADETEPALSPEGFTLLFSSNREGPEQQYALYRSTAKEVFEEVEWNASAWQAFVRSGVWWKALLITAAFAAALAALWLLRGWLFEKASTLRFFFASLLVNFLAVLLLLFVPLTQAFYDTMKEIELELSTTQILEENEHQSHEKGDEPWEKFADVQGVEPIEPAEIPRQITQRPNVAARSDTPIIRLRTRVSPTQPVQQTETVQPQRSETQPAPLQRQTLMRPVMTLPEPLPTETAQAESQPTETPLRERVDVARRDTRPAMRPAQDALPRRSVALQPAEPSEVQPARPVDERPTPKQVAQRPLESRRVTPQIQTPSPVATEAPQQTPLQPAAEQPLETKPTQIVRRDATVKPSTPAVTRPANLPRTVPRMAAAAAAPAQAPAESVATRPVDAPPLSRQVEPRPDEAASLNAAARPDATPQQAAAAAVEAVMQATRVALERSQQRTVAKPSPAALARRAARMRPVEAEAGDLTAKALQPEVAPTRAPAQPQLASRTTTRLTPQVEATTAVAAETPAAVESKPVAETPLATTAAELTRRGSTIAPATPRASRPAALSRSTARIASALDQAAPAESSPGPVSTQPVAAPALRRSVEADPDSVASLNAPAKLEATAESGAAAAQESALEAARVAVERARQAGLSAPAVAELARRAAQMRTAPASAANLTAPETAPEATAARVAAVPDFARRALAAPQAAAEAPAPAPQAAGAVEAAREAELAAAAAKLARLGPQLKPALTRAPSPAASRAGALPVRASRPLASAVAAGDVAPDVSSAQAELARRQAVDLSLAGEKAEQVELTASGTPSPAGEAPTAAATVEVARAANSPMQPAPRQSSPAPRLGVNLPRAESIGARLRTDLGDQTPSRTVEGAVARAAPKLPAPADLTSAQTAGAAAAQESVSEGALPSQPVEFDRSLPPALEPAAQSAKTTGPRNRKLGRIDVGSLARLPVDAKPSVHSIASRLLRRPARAKPVAYAQDNVGMKAMFTLRQGAVRREFIELLGGTDETEEAVRLGLEWLARYQHTDGRWSLNNLNPKDKELPKVSGGGNKNSDTAATGFGLLPFLGAGHSHTQGDFKETVASAISWLVENQKENGDLFVGPDSQTHMYSHGVAAIALCEAYGISRDPALREPAQKSLDFIVSAQHRASGGWRYRPNERGDTSVVGWQVMALKSGEMAGLNVPAEALSLAGKWLDSCEGKGGSVGRYGYQGAGGTPAMTAEGMLCRQFLGMGRNDPSMRAGGDFLVQHLPQKGKLTTYYWYYATQCMYHMQGEYWQKWNEAMRDLLVNTQVKSGAEAGTWNPTDKWEKSGGRVYSTSLRLLMLEVYYRHLPLYRQLED